ncbi:MAG TPA: undecaprenyl diphosphate synthase family protein [Methanocorpusculum sp.]|nr:undecaprenyl diphosphate synthase family protein [Methanocorpusculum sp.]
MDVIRAPERIAEAVSWVSRFPEISKVIFHISTPEPDRIHIDLTQIAGTVRIVSGDRDDTSGSGTPDVIIAIGKSGKQEICDAIIALAKEHYKPETIDENAIEKHLKFNVTPDFVIKTGESHLTDFLIWQSVYSELFFTDVNWTKFRQVDFLRALRDFQSRKRRFGK